MDIIWEKEKRKTDFPSNHHPETLLSHPFQQPVLGSVKDISVI